jgi:hypothetical protein
MLWYLPEPPMLRRRAADVVRIQIGRVGSLYIGRKDLSYRFTDTWGAEAMPRDGPPRPVPVRVEIDRRLAVVLRFDPKDWKGRLRAVGRLTSGGYSEIVVADVGEGTRPSLRMAEPADTLPLSVHVTDPSGAPAAGVVVTVRALGVPVEATWQEKTVEGMAAFRAIAWFDRPLEVRVAGRAKPISVSANEFWRHQETRVALVAPDAPERRLRVGAPGTDFDVWLLPPGAPGYGSVDARADGDAIVARLPPGEARVIVRVGDRFSVATLAADALEADLPPLEKGSAVVLKMSEGRSGAGILARVEGDRRVLLPGAVVAIATDAEARTVVPAGSYEISWRSGPKEARSDARWEMAPGGQVVPPPPRWPK